MATINEMRQVATQIENATIVGENTAQRVGGLFNDIVDKLEIIDGNETPIKMRRNTAAGFASENPVLDAGELGFETDRRRYKMGDGVTTWNSLAYRSEELDATPTQDSTNGVESGGVYAALKSITDVIGEVAEETPISTTWVQGAINGSTGAFITSTLSIRSGFIQPADKIHVQCAAGYFVKIIDAYNSASDTNFDSTIFSSYNGSSWDTTKTDVTVEGNGKYIVILIGKGNGYDDVTVAESSNVHISIKESGTLGGTIIDEILTLEGKVYKISNVKPSFTFDYIGGTTGDFSINDNRSVNGLWCSTPRFIKTEAIKSIRVNRACSVQTYFYDENKSFLAVKVMSVSADVDTDIDQSVQNYAFVKFSLGQSATDEYCEFDVTLTGVFPENWDVFNKRTNNGFHPINVVVNVTNPTSADGETQTVQDEFTPLPNYGLIALPTTYKEDGKPTRLIIYCHGAGTHIVRGATSFDINRHVDPTYWLAEGYAVMDMDGNPFDTTFAHAFIPQAVDCYVAGYKWAIEHYNICRDGVFLGGRSMGGGNTLYLMNMQCKIPLVAACSNLPTSLALAKDANNKAFGATHRGFILPEGFSWSNGTDSVPYNSAERQVVLANWNKFIATEPITCLITDFPTDEQWRADWIASCSLNNTNRITLMQGLHAVAKCPLKMFSCNQDPNNTLETAAGLYKKIFDNSGQIAELRIFNSYKDYTGTGYTAHYYELQDPALRTSQKSVFGETVNNVPMVYVEMLQFWRRYEQGN